MHFMNETFQLERKSYLKVILIRSDAIVFYPVIDTHGEYQSLCKETIFRLSSR